MLGDICKGGLLGAVGSNVYLCALGLSYGGCVHCSDHPPQAVFSGSSKNCALSL